MRVWSHNLQSLKFLIILQSGSATGKPASAGLILLEYPGKIAFVETIGAQRHIIAFSKGVQGAFNRVFAL